MTHLERCIAVLQHINLDPRSYQLYDDWLKLTRAAVYNSPYHYPSDAAMEYARSVLRHQPPTPIETHGAQWMGQKPIDMILFCPTCNAQHIDAPDPLPTDAAIVPRGHWLNPPHRTHQCRLCWAVWRPSDHATNGVLHLASNRPDEMKTPRWEPMNARITLNTPTIRKDMGERP